jgi:hypothetical protein
MGFCFFTAETLGLGKSLRLGVSAVKKQHPLKPQIFNQVEPGSEKTDKNR